MPIGSANDSDTVAPDPSPACRPRPNQHAPACPSNHRATSSAEHRRIPPAASIGMSGTRFFFSNSSRPGVSTQNAHRLHSLPDHWPRRDGGRHGRADASKARYSAGVRRRVNARSTRHRPEHHRWRRSQRRLTPHNVDGDLPARMFRRLLHIGSIGRDRLLRHRTAN